MRLSEMARGYYWVRRPDDKAEVFHDGKLVSVMDVAHAEAIMGRMKEEKTYKGNINPKTVAAALDSARSNVRPGRGIYDYCVTPQTLTRAEKILNVPPGLVIRFLTNAGFGRVVDLMEAAWRHGLKIDLGSTWEILLSPVGPQVNIELTNKRKIDGYTRFDQPTYRLVIQGFKNDLEFGDYATAEELCATMAGMKARDVREADPYRDRY